MGEVWDKEQSVKSRIYSQMSYCTNVVIGYYSEVSDLDTGLLLEVWEKGMLWDRAIGYYWCPLNTIPFTQVLRGQREGGFLNSFLLYTN